MIDTATISFRPPLPCSAIVADGEMRCGKESTVATVYLLGGGQYAMQPMCRACVLAMQRVYGGQQDTTTTTDPATAEEEMKTG